MNMNPSNQQSSRVKISLFRNWFSFAEWGLWTILGFSLVIGLFGYGFFTLNPENLLRFSGAASIYAPAMIIGAQLQSVGFVALMAVCVWQFWGARLALVLLAVLSVIGFVAEWIGTTTAFPFGDYSYTHMLGYKLLGEVPWVIPPSWFAMGIPCFVIAQAVTALGARVGQRISFAKRVLIIAMGAWLLMSWDLILDPAMSALLPYWEWHEPGFYYNSPLANFFGWFGVGVVIMVAIDVLTMGKDLRSISAIWCLSFYALNWAMSAGMCLLAGEWFAVVVALTAVAPLAVAAVFGYRQAAHRRYAQATESSATVQSMGRVVS
jgi:putative membrane protein